MDCTNASVVGVPFDPQGSFTTGSLGLYSNRGIIMSGTFSIQEWMSHLSASQIIKTLHLIQSSRVESCFRVFFDTANLASVRLIT